MTAKPEMDTSAALSKSASDKGETGRLTCQARGAPDIKFKWSRLGSVVDKDDSGDKYEVKDEMVDRWVSSKFLHLDEKHLNVEDFAV